MAKTENIKVNGIVTEALSNAWFRIQLDLDTKPMIIAQASGKIRLNRIRIVLGDKVEIEMSPMDLTKGRISRRL
jgi:translation initiation factor IF-1